MKKLIIATALSVAAAVAANAQAPEDKTPDAATAVQASPGVGVGQDDSARAARPPESGDSGDRRPEVRLNPVRAPTPDDVTAAPDGEAKRAPTPGTPAAGQSRQGTDEAPEKGFR